MTDKKREPKHRVSGEFERTLTEILVADKRSTEPFIKGFTAVGENVTKLDLGMLVGVFEVEEKSEDTAYIVNFLASVAKKEYFNNPRRGAIESFEAALHKVNVALAELVKHGNVAWLGKLHGALAVLEKNNCHFSVTGQASILLLRQGTMSEISEGLASDEAINHPLKTFVEISSGRLFAKDTLLLATPELCALFSLESLAKQAERMGEEGFLRFLHTALVNELDMSAVLVVNVSDQLKETKSVSSERKSTKVNANENAHLTNVFSERAFHKPEPEVAPLSRSSSPAAASLTEEYVDSKTGHIYVHGEVVEESTPQRAFLEKFIHLWESLQLFMGRFGTTLRRTSRKAGKSLGTLLGQAAEKGKVGTESLAKKITQQSHQALDQWKAKRERSRQQKTARREAEALETIIPSPQSPSKPIETSQPLQEKKEETAPVSQPLVVPWPDQKTNQPPTEKPFGAPPSSSDSLLHRPNPTLQSKLSRFYAQEDESSQEQETEEFFSPSSELSERAESSATFREKLVHWVEAFLSATLALGEKAGSAFEDMKAKTPTFKVKRPNIPLSTTKNPYFLWIALGGLVLLGVCAWLFFGGEEKPQSDSTPVENVAPAITQNGNGSALLVEKSFSIPGGLRGLVLLDNVAYAAAPRAIIEVESGNSYPAPISSGDVRYMAAMTDLRLIFLLTSENQLFTWSPLSKTFEQNSLPLPSGANVRGMGTYLTYLYVLDSANDQVYRFPRIEGGFGSPTNWLRQTVAINDDALLAVNETIALAPTPDTLTAFFQGREAGRFSTNNDNSLRAIASQPDTTFLYALSASGENIYVWNLERSLQKTYHLKDKAENPYLAADPTSGTLYLGHESGSVNRYTNVKP